MAFRSAEVSGGNCRQRSRGKTLRSNLRTEGGDRPGAGSALGGHAHGSRRRPSPSFSPGSGILAPIAPMIPREPQVSPGFGSCSLLILDIGPVVKGAAAEAVLVSAALEAPQNAWKVDRDVCEGRHSMNQRHAERWSNPDVLFILGLLLSTALCSRSRLTRQALGPGACPEVWERPSSCWMEETELRGMMLTSSADRQKPERLLHLGASAPAERRPCP